MSSLFGPVIIFDLWSNTFKKFKNAFINKFIWVNIFRKNFFKFFQVPFETLKIQYVAKIPMKKSIINQSVLKQNETSKICSHWYKFSIFPIYFNSSKRKNTLLLSFN